MPMTDFADLDDALVPADRVTAVAFLEDLARMQPLVDALVAGFGAGRVILDKPEERRALVELHAALDGVIGKLAGARTMIEQVFLQAAVARKAEAIPLDDGREVRYEAPRGEYVGDMAALRRDLLAIAALDGSIPTEIIDDALTTEVTVKADNRKLNAIAKKYGEAAAGAIAKRRTYVTPPPERGRVRFPR